MNGWICNTSGLGILLFESNDPDSLDRSIQPVYYQYQNNTANQIKLNSYQDHNCDSFYNSQKRISRFPGLAYGGEKDILYNIVMTGTPPQRMRWKFEVMDETAGMTVAIHFPSALSRSVVVDGEEVPYTRWLKKSAENPVEGYAPVSQSFCGENRYIGVRNILEFYLDGTCEIHVQPRDAIQTKVRMEWTMDEFFDNGGTTAFIDRLCGSLGIHASTVKVVGVAAGSVQVEYEITPSPDEPLSLAQIQARQTEQFATGQVDLGAPVLDVEGNGESIVADGVAVAPGFTSVVLVRTDTNADSLLWIEWIQPWLWGCAQIAGVDTPAAIFYEFLSLGLVWLWNELAQEVYDLAKADGVKEIIEEHVPTVAPGEPGEQEEREVDPDAGQAGLVGDDGFEGGL